MSDDKDKIDAINSTVQQCSDSNELSSSMKQGSDETNSANDNDNQNKVPSEQSNNDDGKGTNSGHTQNGDGSQENDALIGTNQPDQSNPSEHAGKTSPDDIESSNSATENLPSVDPTPTTETIDGIELSEKESIDTEDDENEQICSVCTSATFNHQPINNTTSDVEIDKSWLNPQYHDDDRQHIKKPDQIEKQMQEPPGTIDEDILDRIQGSIIGMALGDALGAHVEFRPRKFLVAKPVEDLKGGGTWGLEKGQFTDDTSMALCLANSLIARQGFNAYDQLVRYKWWYKFGYMSSTGQCFDIGNATRRSIEVFERRQKELAEKLGITLEEADFLSDSEALKDFDVNCSYKGVSGNGALMRLTPVPLFFYEHPTTAVELSGQSGKITHGDDKAYDACRYYGALIVAALQGHNKKQLLSKKFYSRHKSWFGKPGLHPDVKSIAEGSFKNQKGYDGGIRGKGYIVSALEAALWAFWSDNDSFETGALAAVNLGDDTDTTAAIYGQLAGAFYGYKNLPPHWLKYVYAHKFLKTLSKWIAYEGQRWQRPEETSVQQRYKGSN